MNEAIRDLERGVPAEDLLVKYEGDSQVVDFIKNYIKIRNDLLDRILNPGEYK